MSRWLPIIKVLLSRIVALLLIYGSICLINNIYVAIPISVLGGCIWIIYQEYNE